MEKEQRERSKERESRKRDEESEYGGERNIQYAYITFIYAYALTFVSDKRL